MDDQVIAAAAALDLPQAIKYLADSVQKGLYAVAIALLIALLLR